MKSFFAVCFFLSLGNITAQLETQNWYFGNNAGVTFATTPPSALLNGAISTYEGSSTFSDAQGNLLFYTDGMFVYNKLHQQMPNGYGLLGNPSSAQSGVIVPMPGSTTKYYVFTVDAEGGPNGFRYSEVDMSLDAGLGDVIIATKNTLLFSPSVEKVASVSHANGLYYWVIAHGLYNNSYYAYLVDCNGINSPIISMVGQTEGNPGWGYLSSSPNGSKLASAMCNQGFELLDFNNQSGIVSNPILLLNPSQAYGISFSPNSQILYGCKIQNGSIYQWDLSLGNQAAIISSMQVIGTGQGTPGGYKGGAIQQGLDGKLYIPHFNQSYLSCINNPNQIGSGCNLQHFAIDLQGNNAQLGLPPFVQSFFTPQISIIHQAQCNNISFSSSPAIQGLDSVLWNFGDTQSGPLNQSEQNSPTHIYPGPGNYIVSLIRYASCISDTVTYNLTIDSAGYYETQNVQTCDSFYIWNGQTLTEIGTYQEINTTLLGCDSVITLNLILGPTNSNIISLSACEQYNWNGQTYLASGTYQNILQTIYGCDSILELELTIKPSFELFIDTVICQGEQMVFNGTNYNNPGVYNISLQSINGCDSLINLTINEVMKPSAPDITSNIPICSNDSVYLFSSVSQGDIFWNGPANFSSNFWFNSIPASSVQSGIYAAWIEQNGCFSDTNEVLIKIENLINTSNLEIPNIITPNNDQINDSWHPNETLKNCFEFELIILNRWGEVVYTIDQFGDPFSGKDNTGKDLNDGIYFYSLSIDNQQINGFIHLIH